MHRTLTAVTAGVAAALVVVSSFAQTPPKKKKKHKHPPSSAPAATAHPTPAAAASEAPSPELYVPPKEVESAPTPPTPSSAAPSSEPAAKGTLDVTPSSETTGPASPKHDDGAHDGALPPFSLAALGGWGFNAAAKLALGARAGYTLPFHVYVGATFVYHLGESENGGTASFLYPGGEAGYDLTLGPLLVRPYVGVGALVLHETLPPESATRMYFAWWPGVTMTYAIVPAVFVGVDARYLLSGYDFLGLFGTVGARF